MMNRPHPITLAAIAAVTTLLGNLATIEAEDRKEPGYPDAHADDGSVKDAAFVKTDAAAPMAADINGITHHEYQRMREEQRVYQRQNAVQMVVQAMPYETPVSEMLARADAIFGFIHCGAVGDQPVNLGRVTTEALVEELGARVS